MTIRLGGMMVVAVGLAAAAVRRSPPGRAPRGRIRPAPKERRIEHDDAALARRAGGGDREAFAALIERHYDRIHRLGARILGDGGEAEDLAQDVRAGLAAKLGSYRGDSLFTTWLYRVVVNATRSAGAAKGSTPKSTR